MRQSSDSGPLEPTSGWGRRLHPKRRLVDFFAHSPSPLPPLSRPENLTRDPVVSRIEAALLTSREPISPRRLMKLCDLPDTGEVRRGVDRLGQLLRQGESAFIVEEIAGGYQLLTRPDLRSWLEPICQVQSDVPLSGPMLETLAIVAYRQPINRADIEAIRGVQVGEILRHLLDKGLVRLAGKEESLGRPFLYGTTPKFLQAFGLRNLNELPMVESLARPPAPPSAVSEPADEGTGEPDDEEEEDSEDDEDVWDEDEEDEESE